MRGSPRRGFFISAVLIAVVAWNVAPAAAQVGPAKRGAGAQVDRQEAKRGGDPVIRGRAGSVDSERGRVSGRADRSRGAAKRGDDRIAETRDGRRDRARTTGSRSEQERQRRIEDVFDRGNDRYDRPGGERGPKFCQNGQGHPVHGMAWCREKGFGRHNDRWDWRSDRGWDDIIIGRPDGRNRTMGRGVIDEVLGSVLFGRLDAHRRSLQLSMPLVGRWQDGADANVLRVDAGTVPVAELIDRNRDGRVDQVRLR